MAATKGNKWWMLRSKHGRDKLFKTPELLWEAACEYFQWAEDNPIKDPRSFGQRKVQRPFTIQGFTAFIGANTDYWRAFKSRLSKKDREDFGPVIKLIEDTIYRQKFENAVIGVYKDNIIARDLGLADKSESRLTDKDGNDAPKSLVFVNAENLTDKQIQKILGNDSPG